ncbi:sulfatase-like hydrolase/transferase [soil metagenome]
MKHHSKIRAITVAVLLALMFTGCKKNLNNTAQKSTAKTEVLARTKPNIIFIVGDDVGYEIPTINGGQSYATPNLDKLARDGMRFTQCRSAALCSPSRFMLLTGKYNFRNYTVWGKMDPGQRTIGNMLKDGGYATCYGGKWQLDGGDPAIRNFGFDKYSIWLPFKICPEDDEGSRYKSAKIYQDGGYLLQSFTDNKYSEDIVSSYLLNFIDSNKAKPFFVYYSMILCHKAFSPTPDDPGYAAWVPDPAVNDTAYFPSMVKYMDKKIGLIINKLKTLGIENNTVIFYIGDNGKPKEITSLYQNKSITGGKGSTVEFGIHVPLICKWPGNIAAGTINGNLVDFTDFLPTLAGIANIPVPAYGILDGTSFYPQLKGKPGTPRNTIFTHFRPLLCSGNDKLTRYSQDSAYKLYETGGFCRFIKDIDEQKPLSDSTLTVKQKQIKQNLQNVLNTMHN